MACENCPDAAALANPGVVTIVYTGGPPHGPFAAVRAAIPRDGVIRRYEATVHPDGRISYNRDVPAPPVPVGYARDTDPWTLRPVWTPCVYRSYRARIQDDGTLTIAAFCLHPHSGRPTQTALTPAGCEGCATCVRIDQP